MSEPRQIPLRARDGSIRAYALVDADDAPDVVGHRWYLSGGYAKRDDRSTGTRRRIYLHRHLMGLQHGDTREVDHLNLNKLDCRRSNMRIATHAENGLNQPVRKRTSSVHRGVSRHSQTGRWIARASRGGREIYIGIYATELEAAGAFQEWASRVGDFHATKKTAPVRG